MTVSLKPPIDCHFCLVGELEGYQRCYLLNQGDNRVGSLVGNEVIIPVRSVSKHHATLHAGKQELIVSDLASKNGTFVNGVRINEALLEIGDLVRFGSVEFKVAPIDSDDSVVAISIQSRSEPEFSDYDQSTSTFFTNGEYSGLVLIRTFLDEIANGGISSALDELTRMLNAESAMIIEWEGEGEPLTLATAGVIPCSWESSQVSSAFRCAKDANGSSCFSMGEPDHQVLCVVLGRCEVPPLGLVIKPRPEKASELDETLHVLLLLIDALVSCTPRRKTSRNQASEIELVFPPSYVPGRSKAMSAVHGQLRSFLRSSAPVLLEGETGSGKEHLARILHDSSERSSGPFVAINCAAIPADLLEAELFGIVRGAATGVKERSGRFHLARGGTLFLDEIGDMSMSLQSKLLRVLQESEIVPVGGSPIKTDVRIVAATNTNLDQSIKQGLFREDLYYRIAGFTLRVPPLRERAEDIPALVEHFLRKYSVESDIRVRGVTLATLNALTIYHWPGNIRELANEIRRLVSICPLGQAISSNLLSRQISEIARNNTIEGIVTQASEWDLEKAVHRVEVLFIRRALTETNGNRTHAARLLGLSRNGLALKIKRLGIEE